jgi:hypothetical protein
MGQTSNIITLRKQPKNIVFTNYEVKNFLYGLKFLNSFERSLNKKGFLVLNKSLSFGPNTVFLNFSTFYKTKKISDYRYNKIKFLKSKNLFLLKRLTLQNVLVKNFFSLKKSLFLINVLNLNKLLKRKDLTLMYFSLKSFLNILFIRRFNLFIDFLKISSLFLNSKIDSAMYLRILGQIFCLLQKKSHTRFIFFLKVLFSTFLNNKINPLKGVKFIINGKIQGKLRASSTRILVGSVPIQTITANIEFSKVHVYTRYGAFGFKMWVHR